MKYKKEIIVASLIFSICQISIAAMTSDHFLIPSSVISGGGTLSVSSGFKNQSLIGQPSPVRMSSSSSFNLGSGFWYTIAATDLIWDFDMDQDIDGLDLQSFMDGFGTPGYNSSDLESFRQEFGISE